jgi:hypothetical protein
MIKSQKGDYKMKKIIILLAILTFQADIVLAKEAADVTSLLKAKLEQAQDGEQKIVEIRITDEQLKVADPNEVLALLATYEKTGSRSRRHLAYFYEVQLAHLQPKLEVRQEVTKRLVNAILDPNSGVSGHACSWLLSFKEEDFTDTTKATISRAMTQKEPSMCLIRICGVANIKEQLPLLKELLIDELEYKAKSEKSAGVMWYHLLGWQSRLARARMGVQEDINKCIELAEAEENLDNRVIVLLSDIGYIRQPDTIRYLQKYLESDEKVSPEALGEPVASYAMDILAESLSNYPIKRKKIRSYSQDEINLCRKWMSEQKEWKIIR